MLQSTGNGIWTLLGDVVSDIPTKSIALSWLDPEQIWNKEYDQERTAVPCELQTDARLEDVA